MKILVIGLLVLLAMCVYFFDGKMAPAMWQLSGVIWIAIWFEFIKEKS